ncbi:MAG: GNAT family N-acetyltransferase [Acidobacteriota bacterium]
MAPISKRLTFRPLAPDDLAALHDMLTDPHVRRYLLDDTVVPESWTRQAIDDSQQGFAGRDRGLYLLRLRDTAEPCGFAGFRFFDFAGHAGDQLIYGLLPTYTGRGLAREAARAVVDFAFETLGLVEVIAAVDEPNVASIRVLEAIGMERFDVQPAEAGWNTYFYRSRPSTAYE